MSDSPACLTVPEMLSKHVRRSARVALLDPTRAVLLIRSRFRRKIDGVKWAWFLPGRIAHDSYRWWQIPELGNTFEVIFPLGIATALNRFEGPESWPGPMRLDW